MRTYCTKDKIIFDLINFEYSKETTKNCNKKYFTRICISREFIGNINNDERCSQ